MAENQGFLRRWSRRKAEARTAAEPTPEALERLESPSEPPAGAAPPAEEESFDVSSLPDIETLHAGSDFKAFLREGVPRELRTMALRKLWRLDPTLANLDGLVDYGQDFRANQVSGALKTAYRVGKGFLRDEPEVADPAADTRVAAPADERQDETAGIEDAGDLVAAQDDQQRASAPRLEHDSGGKPGSTSGRS